jgi:uncharacterized protein (DUF302 family)
MQAVAYGYEKHLSGTSFGEAKERVVKALANEGFGILSEIDVQATLRKKLDVDFRPYVILGACNPHLAHRALEEDPQIGLVLPCNVVVQDTTEGVMVSIARPRSMFSVVGRASLEPVVADADRRMKRVIDAL